MKNRVVTFPLEYFFRLFSVFFRYDVCTHHALSSWNFSFALQLIFKYLIEESLKNAELFLRGFFKILWTCEQSSLYCHVPFFPFWFCLLNTTNYWTITYWSWSKLVSFLLNLPFDPPLPIIKISFSIYNDVQDWFLIERFISFWIFFKTYILLNKVDMAMFTFFYSLVNRKTLFFCLRNRSWNRFFNFNFLLLEFFFVLKRTALKINP